jgi:uncharacterized protein YbjT (DUF2867 family)
VSKPVLGITGGTGFVGKTLIREALAQGHRVRALTRSPQPEHAGIEWVTGALDKPDTLSVLARGSDAVIHVAGVVNAPDRAGFEAGNVAGTLAMIEATGDAGVRRFVHVSSLSARKPELSVYGWSKAKGENLVQASGLDWTIVRPPAIFGPEDREMLDLFRMARRGFVLLPPEGQISVIEVSDLARLLLAVLPASEAQAQIFEADDGTTGGWTHSGFGKAIGEAVGNNVTTLSAPAPLLNLAARLDRFFRGSGAKLTADRVRYFCHPDWVIDTERRPPAALWRPAIETREGLKATALAYTEAGWLKP